MIQKPYKMKLIRNVALAALGVFALTSCDAFKDDLGTCPKAQINLTFTWNMNFIDKFQDDVHCIDVYVFQITGTKAVNDYQTKFFTYAELSENEIKSGVSSVDLNQNLKPGETISEGRYIAVIHGGNNCSLSSFDKGFDLNENLTLSDLSLHLNESYYDNPNLTEDQRKELEIHDSFFGIQEFTVSNGSTTVTTIDLKRNTNKIHVNMVYKDQSLFTDFTDYDLEITDDNNDLLNDNTVEPTGVVTYRPFSKTVSADKKTHSSIFSVSRLVNDVNPNLPVLTISKAGSTSDKDKVELHLIEWIKNSDAYKNFNGITSDKLQEYLDRNYDWEVRIELGEYNGFLGADIVVKPWEARNDEIDVQ